ncbi:hypothetical protein O6H91_09G023200 [Diphasiastrum complanatum]|uniref:Uncharacterized protein n=2 Tax=Diphasiastrum complanatum TaxID=34168 RepID=A0ACC2CM34_DIPCM|nr:hypothetical protein O6H91_09G023100 [Diphasiastrum complanatum]KAJ7543048.1 hypothetical protein O6H91_09G023200 [Diphasiastrum complanatum]
MAAEQNVVQAEPAKSFLEKRLTSLANLLVLGPAQLNVVLILLLPIGLLNPFTFPIAILIVTFLVVLGFVTVDYNSALGKRISQFILPNAVRHFPVKIVAEDLDAFDNNRSYVFGGEPHSILPLGYISLLEHSNLFPVKNIRLLVGSTALRAPFIHQLWKWFGCAPASKEVFHKLLKSGTSVIIIPGGVQECLYMRPGCEVAFLKKRFGFVRIAIQEGSPLVPVFIFNQTKTYSYVKLGHGEWFNKFSRKVGVAPIWIWGEYLSIIPHRTPLYIAVGKPIEVKKIDNPSNEEIGEVHAKFLKAFEELFEKHKEAAGNKDTVLELY